MVIFFGDYFWLQLLEAYAVRFEVLLLGGCCGLLLPGADADLFAVLFHRLGPGLHQLQYGGWLR